jgi:hypothetical protein
MISLQFNDVDKLYKELDKKILGIQEVISPSSKNQIAKAIFTVTSKKFVKDFALASKANPQKYFHMYEDGYVGNASKKLYTMKRANVISGNLTISFNYKKAKQPNKIPLGLKSKKGKTITAKSIFYNRAEAMESGRPISFTTKKYIAFLSKRDDNVHFLPPRYVVNIMNPGGRKTNGSFEKFATNWYAKKTKTLLNSSRLLSDIQSSVAVALSQKGAGPESVKSAIRNTTEKYSQGVIEL